MLYLTLLTPILALPAVLLMDRFERWASGGRPAPARVAPMADVAHVASGPREPLPQRGRPRPASRSRLLADPTPDLHRPKVAFRS
jgi:hypothetical protein